MAAGIGGGKSRRRREIAAIQAQLREKRIPLYGDLKTFQRKSFGPEQNSADPGVLVSAIKRITFYGDLKTLDVSEFSSRAKLGGPWSFALGHKTDYALRRI